MKEAKIILPPGNWLIVCTAGNYESSPGICSPCPVGKYCLGGNPATAVNCVPGQFQGLTGQAFCNICSAGSYQSNFGQTSAIFAAVDTFLPAGQHPVAPVLAVLFQRAVQVLVLHARQAHILQVVQVFVLHAGEDIILLPGHHPAAAARQVLILRPAQAVAILVRQGLIPLGLPRSVLHVRQAHIL